MPDIAQTIAVAAPAERVYAALTTPCAATLRRIGACMLRTSRVAARLPALVALLASALAFGCTAPLAAEPADDGLVAARATLSAARAMLLAHLAAAKTHSDDAYDIVYRLNAAAEALDGARARAEPEYARDRELAAKLDATWVRAVTSGLCEAPAAAGGASETCFRATSDGTLQPLALYVPSGIERTPPVVIVLRGRGQTESDLLARHELRTLADGAHAILIAPYARGRATYDGAATQDVFDALATVEQARAVDRTRVYVAGFSMGGIAAFHVAGVAPQRFAAVLSIVGALDGVDREPLRAFAGRAAYVVNGESDAIIAPAHGRAAARYLRSIGVLARYYEQPHGAHDLRSMLPALSAAWHDMFAGITAASHATTVFDNEDVF